MTQLIPEAGPLNERQTEYIRQQNSCVCQLMDILNNLIDLQTLKNGKMKLARNSFNLVECIKSAIDIIKSSADSKKLPVDIKCKSSIPPKLIGDSQRLRQILINLLNNSVKYTDTGFIRIIIKAIPVSYTVSDDGTTKIDILTTDEPENLKKWRVSITVADTGVGILPHKQAGIFDTYQRFDEPRYEYESGLGLGLSICKHLVELMNGEITVYSKGIPGKGTKFTVHLTMEEEAEIGEIIKGNSELLLNSKILVVDDKKQNRIILNSYLLRWGCSPVIVESVEEAVQYISVGVEFRCAVIDIHMPLTNGIDFAKMIREKNTEFPLIALSSLPEKFLQENNVFDLQLFDRYCYKPIVENSLLSALIECLKKQGQTNFFKKPVPVVKSRKRIKVLITDDNLSNAYIIQEILKSLKIRDKNMKSVSSGKACISEITKGHYDIIFMDLRMRGMNGAETTEQLLKLGKKVPPIIGISAGIQSINKDLCLSCGMSGYLTKPIVKDEIEKLLSTFFVEK
jgi:CheY-like chemotaxis protein